MWWESQAVYWASWRGRRETVVKKDDKDDVELIPDGTRWGHWFLASIDLADNVASLNAEAWRSGGRAFWNTPKDKSEMFPLMELLGVRLLGPKHQFSGALVFDRTEGTQNMMRHHEAIAKEEKQTTVDFFSVLLKQQQEEEDEGDEETRAKKRRLKDVEAVQQTVKPLRYKDGDLNAEVIHDLAREDPEYKLFPVAHLEAAEDVDDLEPVLDF